MTYGVAIQVPEAPIVEQWLWITDVSTSYDGTEDRIPLLRYPRRTITGNYRFDEKDSLRRHLAMMTKRFKGEVRLPLFQYQAKLKTAVSAGETVVVVNSRRGNFNVGNAAIIIEGDLYEEVEIAVVNEASVEFFEELVNAYSAKAIVCPTVSVFANTNSNVTRLNPDNTATSSFTFNERMPTLPLISSLNEAVVDTFDGLPLLPYTPVGKSFEGSLETGLGVVEYTGLPDLVSPWTLAQWSYPLTFEADSYGGVEGLEWWQVFADTIQGSANAFLIATNREDFELVEAADLGGTGVTVKGNEYTQHYWGHGGFSRIFIDSDAGRHYAKITGVSSVAGDDRLTFDPPLPVGTEWANNQRVGFLLKVRNANDTMTVNHYGLSIEVSFAVRTVV